MQYPIPTDGSITIGITTGLGAVWFAEQTGNGIGRLDPHTGTIVEFPISGDLGAFDVAAGFGAVWFTGGFTGDYVGRLDPGTGLVETYDTSAEGLPAEIVANPSSRGGVWFTEITGHNVGMIEPRTGTITEFPTPTPESRPFGIASGFGSIWFAESNVGQLGEL